MNDEVTVLKIAIGGDMGVGKSMLLRRLAERDLDYEYISTIGVDCMFRSFPDKN